jgi:hypothetical protein
VATKGIEGVLIETRNWGKTVAFWQALGYEVEFETDHNSGMLRNPAGGPYLFVAEQLDRELESFSPILSTADSTTFTPPSAGEVVHGFEPQHWDVVQMLLADPDGRHVGVEAPLPEGVEAPAGHH